jgi:hypothetical protein
MSVTLLILALFIGTAITPATAGLPASMPNNEKAEVAVEETVAEPVESQEELLDGEAAEGGARSL